MPKPFFFIRFRRNFSGSGTVFGEEAEPYDNRVDWVSGDGVRVARIIVPSGRLTVSSDPPTYIYTFAAPGGSLTIGADQTEIIQTLAGVEGSLTIGADPAGLIYALSSPGGSLTIGSDASSILQPLLASSGSLTIGSDPAGLNYSLLAGEGSLTIGADPAALLYELLATSGSLTIGSDPAGIMQVLSAVNGSLTIGSDVANLAATLLASVGSLTIASDAPTLLGLDVPLQIPLPDELRIIGGDVFVASNSTPFAESTPAQAQFLSIIGGSPTIDIGEITVQVSEGAAGQMFTQGGAADIILINEELIQASQTTIGVSGFRATVQPDINPIDIDGLIGWWDADDPSTIRDASNVPVTLGGQTNVRYWIDKKSGISMEQATVAQQPVYARSTQAGNINGKFVLDFDGVDDNLSTTTIPSSWDSLDDMTICYVVNPTDINQNSRNHIIFGYRTSGNGGGRFVGANIEVDGRGFINSVGTLLTPTDIDASSRPNWAIITTGVSPTFGGGLYNDNTSAGTGSVSGATPSAASNLYIGHWAGVNDFKGQIAEILVFNKQLGASDRQRVAAYFDRKWFTAKTAPTDYIVGFNETSEKWQETGRFTLADADGDSVRSIQNDGSLGGWFEWQAGGVPTLEFTDGAAAMPQAAVTQATKGYFSLPDADELTPKSGQGFEVFVSFATSTTDTNIGPIGKWENSPTSEQEWYMSTQSSNTDLSTTSGIKGSGGGAVSSWLGNGYDVRDGNPHVSHVRIGTDDVIQMGLDGNMIGARTQVTDFPSNPSGTVQELILFAYDDNYTFTGFTGSIRAVRIYDRELTDAERASVIEEMSR